MIKNFLWSQDAEGSWSPEAHRGQIPLPSACNPSDFLFGLQEQSLTAGQVTAPYSQNKPLRPILVFIFFLIKSHF